ncbi:MAG: membrane protein insertion efficiency factor YidD [Sedimentisphaerales bacterium]|nr:membrane protein insertion efficiency factor YidD [Sedimentisphaerales bacterium]
MPGETVKDRSITSRRLAVLRGRWPRVLACRCVRLYQLAVSPYLPNACRYVPTCSGYALEALERHGFWKGAYLAIRRLLRCHPGRRGGYDPVP